MNLILSAAQHKEADRNASAMGIPSMVLMERAALATADVLCEKYAEDLQTGNPVLVVCGTGNNAGDGVAVARILCERGIRSDIYLIGKEEKFSDQLRQQLTIISHYPVGVIHAARDENGLLVKDEKGRIADFHPEAYGLIVDAIFGIGIHREVNGDYADVINQLNEAASGCSAGNDVRPGGALVETFDRLPHALHTGIKDQNRIPVVAIDMPSGVHTNSGLVYGTAVRADTTVTFTTGKSGLYMYPGAFYAGQVLVRRIGIPVSEEMADQCGLFSLEEKDLEALPARDESGNKGTFKKILVIAGSEDICGAAYLSAKAALLCGVGMVKIYTHEANRGALASLFPEALLSVYSEKNWKPERLKQDMDWADAFLIGPGLGTGDLSLKILETFVSYNETKPVVLDADALNLLAGHTELFGQIRFPFVGTPHMGEMSRLTHIGISDIKKEAVSVARRIAEETGNPIILKDARTVTALSDGRCFLNLTGNSALSTAGSGDVLAGMVTAFVALYGQSGLPVPPEAMAVYLHGRCGELAAEKYSEASVTAGNLLEFIPQVI